MLSFISRKFIFYFAVAIISAIVGILSAIYISNYQLTSEKTQKNQRANHTEKKGGRWFKVETKNSNKNKNVEGLGYLSGYEKSKKKGVTVHLPSNSWKGLNFYVTGHAPEATLMKMSGEVVHKWSFPWKKAFPDVDPRHVEKGPFPDDGKVGQYWTYAYVYPNGDLLAFYKDFGMIKLNRNSELVWAKPIRSHHDIWVSSSGNIYVITREPVVLNNFRFPSDLYNKVGISDFIVKMNPKGEILKKYSILKSLLNSKFSSLLKLVPDFDIFHTNTLEIITEEHKHHHPAFKPGNAIISMRRLNFIGIIDLSKEQIVWGKTGRFLGQHDPRILPNGNLLVYDNRKGGKYSRIVEIAPDSWKVKWELSGSKDVPFYSRCCGRNQPLPNGNILITDTDSGRGFEVTRDKKLVWEYYNPNRLKEKNNYIAAMYAMKRYPKNYFNNWLNTK